jgi:CHAT domain-containing protein/Tfp pilus assembly protein PilF
MNSIRHFCLIFATSVVLTHGSASVTCAQSRQADELNTKISELYKAGKFAQAIPLAHRLLAIRQKLLGPDHPEVATALSNLAAFYHFQGRYAEAEPLYKRSLAIREKALGRDDPVVAESLSNLAMLYKNQGRYAEAEPLFKRALAIEEKALGPDDPDLAITLNNLALLYTERYRLTEAEPLYKRSLAIREKALGLDDPAVSTALSNLAALYEEQGRYAEAEPLIKRALAIGEKTLGIDHPDFALMLNNLASLCEKQGHDAEAELLYKRSLAIREKTLGHDHPDVAASLNNLATFYKLHGRYAEAGPLYIRSLAIKEKALGPNHPDVALSLSNLAAFYFTQGRYAEAELLIKRALAIYERAVSPDHSDWALSLNSLAALYYEQSRYADALSLVRRAIDNNAAYDAVALPILFAAQARKLIGTNDAIDDSLNIAQFARRSSAAKALNALALRFAAGTDRLAQLVRKDQDLAVEAAFLDKAIIAAVSKEPSKRDAAAEQRTRDRLATIAEQRGQLEAVLTRDFPDYAALSKPQTLATKETQALLADDEALVIVNLNVKKSYVWAITNSTVEWRELSVTAADVSKQVSVLRDQLDFLGLKPFDPQVSYALYREILSPVEDTLREKPRLNLVLDGALTSLPPQLLVTGDPTGRALKDVAWLIRTHAVTMLPSIASLKVLRGKSAIAAAAKPLVGFADPIFDRSPQQLEENARVIADVTAARGIRGTVADLVELKTALPRLPETATELRRVADSVAANTADLFFGAEATETRVKQEKLDQYRIVYFATHGLLAGDVADFAKLEAEPALVLSLPEHPTELDDGLLTASEVAQLKLNADWVVLSACNTASAEKPGAEALSGLARAFFYAGARSLVVSNWEIDSDSAVALMTGTFAALTADPKLSHAEALQKSMLAMIDDTNYPERINPKYWAPFVVVGEPAKPTN